MEHTSTDQLHEAVDRGASWLDINRPGWATLVNTEILDLTSSNLCVAGQVFGQETGDGNGYAVMMKMAREAYPFRRQDTHLGFSHPDVDYGDAMEGDANELAQLEPLKAAWLAEIAERTSATVGS